MGDRTALGREADRIADAIRYWTPARWRVDAADGTRADAMAAAVQRIADLAADAERRPRRDVPPPDNPVGWPDRWRVVAADLVAADPDDETLSEAFDTTRRLREELW